MAVDTVLLALSERIPDYELIRDCVAGQRAMKKKRTRYLPDPDPNEPDEKAREDRYESYLGRAVFYGVTGRTLRGLVGLVFQTDPAVQVPTLLEPLLVDVDGSGMSINQQAAKTLSSTVSLGRAGLLTDYPRTAGPVTVLQAQQGNIRPTITRYEPEQVINWRTVTVGSRVYLSLVVLKEQVVVDDDGFAEDFDIRYRVLRLVPGVGGLVYQVELWPDGNGGQPSETYMPTDGNGAPFREIPFTFVGAEENTGAVDRPPLLDLAELNKAHFCNSADYEESSFICGQATPVLTGLTKQWVDEVLKGRIRFGSRGAIALPVGGDATLLQVAPNQVCKEAMEHKEAQMVALGAKLVENTGTQQTATEAAIDSVMDNSVLGTAARNVSDAYRKCLRWAWQFVDGAVVTDLEIIDYELSTDFAAASLGPAERADIVASWLKGAITWDEMRWNLKRAGVAYEDDEVAKESIASAREEALALEADATGDMTDPANAQ